MGTPIDGHCDDRFAAVREQFELNFAERGDVGGSVAVTVDGEMVVDLWGGEVTVDGGTTQRWERDTIINVWSTTKTMTALCVLMLADRGELDLDAPVVDVWPEFGAAGKSDIRVTHLMSHTAGLSGWDVPMSTTDLYDWERCTSLLASQAPWWEPGTASGYHAITQGYLLGEVVRRVSGRTVGNYFADEVAGPLGADFHIGTPAEHDARVGHVIPPDSGTIKHQLELAEATLGITPTDVTLRTLANPELDAASSATIPWRRAEIPAAGGHGNARSVAQVHTPMACGGSSGGVALLSEATIERIFEEQIDGTDLVLGIPFRHGIGFGLPLPELPMGSPRTCFWGGWGGSLAIIDLEARMSFSYVMNKMGEGTVGDERGASLLLAAHASLAN